MAILDTLNQTDRFFLSKIVVEPRPKYSKNKLDFSRIENLGFAERINKSLPIAENQKNPTYLGNYDLSEPVYISKDKAVIKY